MTQFLSHTLLHTLQQILLLCLQNIARIQPLFTTFIGTIQVTIISFPGSLPLNWFPFHFSQLPPSNSPQHRSQSDHVQTFVRSHDSSVQYLPKASHLTQSKHQSFQWHWPRANSLSSTTSLITFPTSFYFFSPCSLHWLPCYAWNKLGPSYFRIIILVTSFVWNGLPLDVHMVRSLTFLRNLGLIQLGWLTSTPCGVIFAHSCFCGELVVHV